MYLKRMDLVYHLKLQMNAPNPFLHFQDPHSHLQDPHVQNPHLTVVNVLVSLEDGMLIVLEPIDIYIKI